MGKSLLLDVRSWLACLQVELLLPLLLVVLLPPAVLLTRLPPRKRRRTRKRRTTTWDSAFSTRSVSESTSQISLPTQLKISGPCYSIDSCYEHLVTRMF